MEASSDKELRQALNFIKEFCFDHKITVAVAESVSSGVVQSLFSSEKEAGLFFEGGITTYTCQQKQRHFGIPIDLCSPCNGVSEEISQRIALKICSLFQCGLGLGLTGFASPIPEENVFELYAFGSIALNGEVIFCETIKSDKKDPDKIRADYAKALIIACSKVLQNYQKGILLKGSK